MNYYISDTHFGHKRVIEHDNRPFDSIEEMEREMVKKWNAKVRQCDTVYILGDFCWGSEAEWTRIISSLSGRKVLIKGSHDLKHISGKLRKYFDDVKDRKEIMDNGRLVIMNHFPELFYRHSHKKDTYMLCGHVHVTRENEQLERFRDDLRNNQSGQAPNRGNIINVGAMMPWMNYEPRTLDELISGVFGC